MKKLIFILMAILSLCVSCSSSSDEDKTVKNAFVYDGKEYSITSVYLSNYHISINSGEYFLAISNCDFEAGKKNYLTKFKNALAYVGYEKVKETGEHTGETFHYWGQEKSTISESSYVTIQNNDEDNRTHLEIYISDGEKTIKATYLGTPRVEE